MEHNNPKPDPERSENAAAVATPEEKSNMALPYQLTAALCYLKQHFFRAAGISDALFRPGRRALLKDLIILGIGGWSLYDRVWHGKSGQAGASTIHPPSSTIFREPDEMFDRAKYSALSSLRFANPIPQVSISAIPPSRLSNAPRAYRHGTHNGFDLYCAHGNDARVIGDGVVTRADLIFSELDAKLYQLFLTMSRKLDTTPPDVLRRLMGRCVEVDHGMQQSFRCRSIYAHLSAVYVTEGSYIHQGDLIGAVGNSGTSAGIRGSRDDAHLHLEIRLQRPGEPESYLGEGLNEPQIRQLLKEVFSGA